MIETSSQEFMITIQNEFHDIDQYETVPLKVRIQKNVKQTFNCNRIMDNIQHFRRLKMKHIILNIY